MITQYSCIYKFIQFKLHKNVLFYCFAYCLFASERKDNENAGINFSQN